MRLTRLGFGAALFLWIALCGWNVSAQDIPKTLKVGAIDFFGAQGMDTTPVLKALPIHSGDVIQTDGMKETMEQVRVAAAAATGMVATKVEVVCCDAPETVDFYIGLEGRSYKPIKHGAIPTGNDALDPAVLSLYKRDMDLVLESIQHGESSEDDSQGYALTKYPKAHAVQLLMREYAVGHTAEIVRVLRGSKDAEQRQASSMLLGYSDRSAEQVAALTAAVEDEDSEVRNNATRAIEVMLDAGPIKGLDATPFIAMLWSGNWSDRNKASLLLDRLTAGRDPALLRQLQGAVAPLEDGARWHSLGHAWPFLDILGRVGGLDDAKLKALEKADARDEIIAAAKNQ
jgi:hypothetical protein